MRIRWFSNWRHRLLAISALGVVLAAVLIVTVPYASAGTPDWLRDTAQT